MALTKKKDPNADRIKVTFSLPAQAVQGAKTVQLAGDFNSWNTTDPAGTMKKNKDGSYSVTLALEKGSEYQFRYLLDGVRWENDWEADTYVRAPHSHEDNSVVQVM
jgi:1,4-alpha-glucan branching enzyme